MIIFKFLLGKMTIIIQNEMPKINKNITQNKKLKINLEQKLKNNTLLITEN